jgi:hypothetical protein
MYFEVIDLVIVTVSYFQDAFNPKPVLITSSTHVKFHCLYMLKDSTSSFHLFFFIIIFTFYALENKDLIQN